MPMLSDILSLIFYLILTIVLEVIFALFVGIRKKQQLLVITLTQVITNPLLNLLGLYIFSYYNWPITWQIPAEIIVVLVEGVIYKKCTDMSRPFAFSLAANYFSYTFGVLLYYFHISS